MNLRLLPVVLVTMLGGLSSCQPQTRQDYVTTQRHGVSTLSWAKQMDAQYEHVDHFITHFGSRSQPLTWNSEAHFGGRFVLTLQVPVHVDYEKRTVSPAGAPTFYLTTLAKVEVLPDGRVQASTQSNLSPDFGKDKWAAFVESGYDLTVLSIPVAEQKAIPNFKEYVAAVRKDRVPIPVDGT